MRPGIRPRPFQRYLQLACWLGIVGLSLTGCRTVELPEHFIGSKGPDDYVNHYLNDAMRIAHPVINSDLGDLRSIPQGPRTTRERLDAQQVQDVSLSQAVQWALTNNKVVRANDRSTLQSNSSRVLTGPDGTISVYDPAIQETGVLFGARGVESALSAFDAQLTSTFNMGRTEVVQNNIFNGAGLPAGSTLQSDTGQWVTQLQKQMANGSQITLSHEVDYLQNNVPTALFPSNYTGNIAANFRQPLLAGSGVEYTRIAGPVGQNIQGLSGVNQGVIIARINNDISIADFESAVTNMVFDVEKIYWDLALAYRRYDSAVESRKAGKRPLDEATIKNQVGSEGGENYVVAQTQTAYYNRIAVEESALAQIDTLEGSLRRICGLPMNDGRILRPSDEPLNAKFKPDWNSDVAMALTRRVELRRQKWNIKSTELQLIAAKSFTQPRLDLVSNYQVNGFGDRLFSDHSADGVTQEGFHNFYDSMLRGHQTSYGGGFQFSMPFGFRAGLAQVRNLELRLAKAREILRAQEDDVIWGLADAYQQLALNWENAQTQFNRQGYAQDVVVGMSTVVNAGSGDTQGSRGPPKPTVRDLLEAQAIQAEAQAGYYQSLIEYTKCVAYVNYSKGSLLELNNIYISEGSWSPKAYEDALSRAWQRTYSLKHPLERKMRTEPPEFVTDADPGTATYGFDPNVPAGQMQDGLPVQQQLIDAPVPPTLTEPQAAPAVEAPGADANPAAPPAADPTAEPKSVETPQAPPEGPVAEQPNEASQFE